MRAISRRSAVFLLAAAAFGGSGCAAIWGFEDAIDRPDASDLGSDDATTNALIDGGVGVTVDRSVADDASADATLDAGNAGADSAPKGDADASSLGGEIEAGAVDGADVDTLDAGLTAPDVGTPCTGTCLPTVESGWEGPFEIYEGTGGPPPNCGSPLWADQYDLIGSPNAAPAACTCSCGPPSGGPCAPPVVRYFRDPGCVLPCGEDTVLGPACTPLVATGCGLTPHFARSASDGEGGACSPNASTTIPPLTWGAAARLCAPADGFAGLCGGGGACAPPLDPLFEGSTYCVVRLGEFSCPSDYTAKHPSSASADSGAAYFGGATDDRACTSCSCGAPEGANCGDAAVITYADDACAVPTAVVAEDAGCVALVARAASCGVLSMGPRAPPGGECAPDGGEPTGGVTPSSPYTICCTR